MILLYLASGLFLGWNLGGNDAANIFGSAVGSRMVRFKDAALVASIFVVLGAVFQGRGGAETLNNLGMVDSLAGAFIVSLSAALVVFYMNLRGLPVSTSQAIVGGILGWVYFNQLTPDYAVLLKIVSTWISGPLLGMLFAAILYQLLRKVLLRSHIHLVELDAWIRFALILTGAFGAYSLGANNIANVMGVFTSMAPNVEIHFGLFSLDGVQVLFLLGGLAIATGIYTISRQVMATVGNGLLALSPEAAIVVVFSQGLVMFLFSWAGLADLLKSVGLPALPLVPVSSTQLVVGSILGIGLVKGTREINTKLLVGIGIGWLLTPAAAALTAYILLFFAKNVFDLPVLSTTAGTRAIATVQQADPTMRIDLILPGIVAISGTAIALLSIAFFKSRQKQLKTENELLQQQNLNLEAAKALHDLNLKNMHSANQVLTERIDTLNREFGEMAMGLTGQKIFIEELNSLLDKLGNTQTNSQQETVIKEIRSLVQQKMSFDKEKNNLYMHAEINNSAFYERLDKNFPSLSHQEKRLALLIRVGLSNKELATMLNITLKSVEVFRYRLKKKFGLDQDHSLNDFIKNL